MVQLSRRQWEVVAHVVSEGCPIEVTCRAAGDNPERVRSEGAFAKLCGTCPIPASSGLTNRHGSSAAVTAGPTLCSIGS